MSFLDFFGWGKEQLEDIQYVGYSYLKQGKYDIAIKFFEILNSLKPNNSYYLQTLGALYLEIDENVKALKYLDASLKITYHLPTLLNKAKVLSNIGYKKQAILLAKKLQSSNNKSISDQASALILSNI